MRLFIHILFFFALTNFSGLQELLPVLLADNHAKCDLIDKDCSQKNTEEEKGSDEEDAGKESVLSYQASQINTEQRINLYMHYNSLNESGYVPEDHSIPPEFV